MDDPTVRLYHLCRTFHCLPSELDRQDAAVMERLSYVDYVFQSKRVAENRKK